jgi:hypothetical protein
VTRMATTHPHWPIMLTTVVGWMTGLLMKAVLSLRQLICCINGVRCLLATLTIFSISGQLPLHHIVIHLHLKITKICIQPLMRRHSEMYRGTHSASNIMVPYLMARFLPGCHQNMMYGSETHAVLSRTSSQILIFWESLIIHLYGSMTQMGIAGTRILCQETGPGSRRYVSVSLFNKYHSLAVIQDIIASEPGMEGSMFVPIILGSDKTTVSVATGNNEYWPVYLSIGNIHNNVRRAHRDGVVLLGFLSIPKSMTWLVALISILMKGTTTAANKEYTKDAKFRKFRRQIFHSSLAKMLESLKPGMKVPEVVRCPDGCFRRAVYGLGPYIADYPEQALLTSIVQGWCPRCAY